MTIELLKQWQDEYLILRQSDGNTLSNMIVNDFVDYIHIKLELLKLPNEFPSKWKEDDIWEVRENTTKYIAVLQNNELPQSNILFTGKRNECLDWIDKQNDILNHLNISKQLIELYDQGKSWGRIVQFANTNNITKDSLIDIFKSERNIDISKTIGFQVISFQLTSNYE
jgi:hypothetical protein